MLQFAACSNINAFLTPHGQMPSITGCCCVQALLVLCCAEEGSGAMQMQAYIVLGARDLLGDFSQLLVYITALLFAVFICTIVLDGSLHCRHLINLVLCQQALTKQAIALEHCLVLCFDKD